VASLAIQLVLAAPLLSFADCAAVRSAFRWDASTLTHSNYPVYPFCLDPYRARRRHLFGRPLARRTAAHDTLEAHLLAHLVWDFIQHREREAMLRAIPALRAYLVLRRHAFLHRATIAGALRQPREPPELIPPLCRIRSWFLGAALLGIIRFPLLGAGALAGRRIYK
jgi:hypothetical protein